MESELAVARKIAPQMETMNVYETELKDLERKIVLQTTQLNVKGAIVTNIFLLYNKSSIKVRLMIVFITSHIYIRHWW